MKPVALITGGSRGIGLGIALALAKSGFDLAINGLRPEADVKQSIEALTTAGADVLYARADISQLSDHAPMLESIRNRFGRLNVLVNNAGVAPQKRADLLDATPESFDRLIATNLRGPHFLTQLAAKWMIDQKRTDSNFAASIINVSSISAHVASISRGEYCISKTGVAMGTQLWAVRLAEFGIDVFEVRPGIIRTDMTAGVGVADKYDKLIEGGLTLQKRWGTPEDVGAAVAMLARGELPYATGQILVLDGGLSVHRL